VPGKGENLKFEFEGSRPSMLIAAKPAAPSQSKEVQWPIASFVIKAEKTVTKITEQNGTLTVYEGNAEAYIDPSNLNLYLRADKISVSRYPDDPQAHMIVAEGNVIFKKGNNIEKRSSSLNLVWWAPTLK